MRAFIIAIFFSIINITLHAQTHDCVFHAGIANALIGGIYDGIYPYGKLKTQGDFGIGAPADIDGELTVLDGHVYQTRYTGETLEPSDSALASFASVHHFKKDTSFLLVGNFSKQQLLNVLDSLFPTQTSMYSFKIKGDFYYVKTRAFPPVYERPALPLSSMLDKQHFFEFNNRAGTFVGYRLPSFLNIWSIPGYHFHWLPKDLKGGGHVVDFIAREVEIEVDFLQSFTVWIPETAAYRQFDLQQNMDVNVKKVEDGK